ncbi:MAG: CapA family protein [bacterium]|nr:CapA family protein [bacterium]
MKRKGLSPVPIAGALVTLILVITSGVFYWRKREHKILSFAAERKSEIVFLSTGDLMLGRSVNFKGWQKKDFSWSLEKVRPWLQKFDRVIVNLENPLVKDCPLTNEGMIFCADGAAAAALASSGVDIATLANNHTLNYGSAGLAQTVDFLRAASVSAVTSDTFLQQKIDQTTFGFLAFDEVSKNLDADEIAPLVAEKSAQVDVLIVALHFGSEYRYQPAAKQKQLAQTLIDSGAKIVLGNHSHWLGPIELYHDGVIVYSHGNFVFDQMWSNETRTGMAIAWNFEDNNLQEIMVYPIWITDYGLANLATGKQAENILQTVQNISGDLGEIANEQLIIKLPRQ